MPFDEDDTRKVQTAVVGRAGSDSPVFLPYDPADFDTFMRGRTREDFYCGTLLGGCGKKLTAKRYTDKKCHFAHRPPVHCRRTANGESSADHLYIGQALQRWLRRQGHRGVAVSYPDLGSGPGGAVELRFASGARLLRVQMDRLPSRTWRDARDRLGRTHADGVHWAYGPDSGLAHNEVEVSGHAVRFSCRTERGTREVYVGTQSGGRAVVFVPLAECRLTDRGIVTSRPADPPTVAPEQGPVPSPVTFPLAPGAIAFTGAVEVPTSAGDGRRHYDVDAQPLGSAAIRARIALPTHVPAPPTHLVHLLDGAPCLLPLADEPTGRWVIRAESVVPLQSSADPRWPELRPPAPPRPPAVGDRERLVGHFRTRLTDAAHRQGLVDWEDLVRSAGHEPADFSTVQRVELFAMLDRPRRDGKPVLSSLVKAAHQESGPAPFFAEVLAGLGWKADLPRARVAEIWERQRKTAYSLVRAERPLLVAPVKTETDEGDLATRLRQALRQVAKGRGVIKWDTLLRQQGLDKSSVPPAARVRLLAAVDRPHRAGAPLLSALVKTQGQKAGPAPFFEDVLAELGWKPTAATPTVFAAWRAGRDAAYLAAGHVIGKGAAEASSKLGADQAALVKTIRRTLVDAARRQVCVGWHTLADAVGRHPKEFTERDRLAVLAAVDRAARTTGVMLSSLVIGAGHAPVPYFADLLRELGRPHDLHPIQLGQVRKYEQAHAFRIYRQGTTA
ncbi:competence protein CoiA [Streptomyces sp. NBC_00249]|uniref:competence protein CoiA family protein n=1 Tax=Streptomyces sp. NBC_00249 TaxID=2975690 RepID=UPI0022551A16|nr:competence protein CoiA family protein [Streptomyces sp. NBC_00249]MCX5194389.1 competence protein CoiA [Streptomyces sp. NBC_00249]